MRGLKKICLLLASALLGTGVSAQNNAYGIDDECFALFLRAEAIAGVVPDEEFNLINDSLLHTVLAMNDKKAQVLYYVERLKHIIASSPKGDDSRIRKAFEELKTISLSYGYRQYFYYAYELVQNYFLTTKGAARL